MAPQHSVSDRVKRPAPKPARIDRQQIRDAIEHLPRGFVGKGEQQDVSRIDSVFEQISDPVSKRARLPRARARDDQKRAGRSCYRRELLFV